MLASLSLAGILVRSGGRRNHLRVSPRFMAHAEGTAGRIHTQGYQLAVAQVLEDALRTWDGFNGDPHRAGQFLQVFLADRDQLGPLQPVFPVLESFACAA